MINLSKLKYKLSGGKVSLRIVCSLLLILLLTQFNSLMAQQGFEQIWAEVEKNNTGLAAMRAKTEADKLESQTGIFLPNPEVEFGLMWGKPTELGQRTNIHIGQSFDFPTAYRYRRQIARGRITQADLEYELYRKELRLQARELCIELTYLNALAAEYEQRLEHATSIARAYARMFETGAANVLDHNKARLALLNEQKEMQSIDVERKALLDALQALNGGKALEFTQAAFVMPSLPLDFENWYKQLTTLNPELSLMRKEAEISATSVALSRAENLPVFSAGFMREALTHESFQGAFIGLSIPLWENKNKLKAAKAHNMSMQSLESDMQLRYYNEMGSLFQKAKSLSSMANEYRQLLQELNHSHLLRTALEQGEISLIEYLMELALYYDAFQKALECEKDLLLTTALLEKYL